MSETTDSRKPKEVMAYAFALGAVCARAALASAFSTLPATPRDIEATNEMCDRRWRTAKWVGDGASAITCSAMHVAMLARGDERAARVAERAHLARACDLVAQDKKLCAPRHGDNVMREKIRAYADTRTYGAHLRVLAYLTTQSREATSTRAQFLDDARYAVFERIAPHKDWWHELDNMTDSMTQKLKTEMHITLNMDAVHIAFLEGMYWNAYAEIQAREALALSTARAKASMWVSACALAAVAIAYLRMRHDRTARARTLAQILETTTLNGDQQPRPAREKTRRRKHKAIREEEIDYAGRDCAAPSPNPACSHPHVRDQMLTCASAREHVVARVLCALNEHARAYDRCARSNLGVYVRVDTVRTTSDMLLRATPSIVLLAFAHDITFDVRGWDRDADMCEVRRRERENDWKHVLSRRGRKPRKRRAEDRVNRECVDFTA